MKKNKNEKELLMELSEIIEQLGWVMGVPDGEDTVQGIIVGTREYVEEVVEAYYGPNFAVYEKDEQGEIVETPPSKKNTLH